MIFKGAFLNILMIVMMLFFSACNGGGDGFGELEDSEITDTDSSTPGTEEVEVKIESFIPTASTVILRESQEVTFGVQVNNGAGNVNYKFYIDNSLVQDSNSTFYILDTDNVTAGSHNLKVVAENSKSSAEHSFATRKNSKPLVSLSSNTSQTISCVSDTFTLSISAVDPDSDGITFSYYLNGSVNSSYLTGTNTSSSAQVVFDPICSQSGSNTVTIRATDSNGDYNEYSMGVTVTNPNVSSIDSYSPTSDPIVVLSSENKTFLVSASGNAPLSYSWAISPGSTIASCNNSASCVIGGGDFSPGQYTLTATVTDALSTTASKAFNVVINDRPSIATSSPSNSTSVKMNCSGSKNFQVKVNDGNISHGQTITVSWYLDNNSHAKLTSTLNNGVYPREANATFSPSCEESLLGEHKVKVVINDGYENQEMEWTVSTNYFSDACNNLSSGEICTLVGMVGSGSNKNVTTDSAYLRLSPAWMDSHPNGIFFTDMQRHGVWFYNPNSDSRTVLGKSVPANSVVAMFGQNYLGTGDTTKTYRDFYLNNPRDIRYDSVDDVLYVADQDNNRIVKFDNTGTGSVFAGGSNGDTDGAANTSHSCVDPKGLALDRANNTLFATCNGNTVGTIKAFGIGSGNETGTTVIKYQANAATAGSTGLGGTAYLGKAYSIVKDPNANILYAADEQKCRLVAISYGGSADYYGGSGSGGVSLTNNRMEVIYKGGSCGSSTGKTWSDTSSQLRMRDLAVYSVSGVTKGIFFANADSHYIGFLNFTTSDITLGGNTISGGYHHRVWGSGAYDYGRGEPAYTTSYGRNPYGMLVSGTTLYIGDTRNGRIATLDLSTGNGASADYIGNHYYSSYDDELDKNANLRQLNEPRAMEFSSDENKIYFVDYANYRIRSINLTNGRVKTEVSTGNGNANSDPENPLDVNSRQIHDISIADNDNIFLFTDYYGSTGATRNCQIRSYNKSSSDQSLWGTLFETGKVRAIAGNYAEGCQDWNISYEGTSALTIPLRSPYGVHGLSDGSAIYYSDYYNHCIHKIDSSGNITTPIGTCGSSGNTNGAFSTSKVSYPATMNQDNNSSISGSGNFFISERVTTNNSIIKYVNFSGSSVNILGTDVSSQTINEVKSGIDYLGSVATFEDQICYSQGGLGRLNTYAHNVICEDRTGASSVRFGRGKSSAYNGAIQLTNEEEGIQASSANFSGPYGLAFDSEGNLYISERNSNTIRMVKKWW